MVNQKQILLTALLAVQAKGAEQRDPTAGICVAVEFHALYMKGVDDFALGGNMRDLFVRWPEYSGDDYFPVPSNTDDEPSDIYFKAGNLWVGPYGESRLRLLDFMVEQLQAELAE